MTQRIFCLKFDSNFDGISWTYPCDIGQFIISKQKTETEIKITLSAPKIAIYGWGYKDVPTSSSLLDDIELLSTDGAYGERIDKVITLTSGSKIDIYVKLIYVNKLETVILNKE
jgi:hypothetical protein